MLTLNILRCSTTTILRKKTFFKEIKLNYVTINEQLVNILTKPLG